MVQRAFVKERRRHRFVLEYHGPDSGLRQCARQAAESELIVFLAVCVGIADRVSDSDRAVEPHLPDAPTQSDVAQHDRDEVFERIVLSKNIRARE